MSTLVGNTIGEYLVIEKLGEGGMAEVYKAYETALERFVALKIVHPGLASAPEFIPRFEREARLLARFNHPNIVRIYGFGFYKDNRPYLVMEYVEGGTLKSWLKEKGRLSITEALPILREVSDALDAAHDQNIIHRDVKPANIMLTNSGRALLSDFGISRLVSKLEGELGSTQVGTPDYMAPEQITPDKDPVGATTDVFALGLVLYAMTAGELPFSGDTPADMLINRMTQPPVPLREYVPELPENVEAVIQKALAKDPAERYPRAGIFVDALEEVIKSAITLEGESAEAWWSSGKTPPPVPGPPPYKGLQYFGVEDADQFFGREELTERLVKRLQEESFLAVVGSSGSGKTSVVRAGVIPALQQMIRDLELHIITPGTHPIETLALSLTQENNSLQAATMLSDDLMKDSRSLRLFTQKRLTTGPLGQQPKKRILLFVDQFEELFTLCRDEVEQEAFINNLLRASSGEGKKGFSIILTMRADFYHHCARFEGLRDALEQHQSYIGAMSREELRRAIEEPARLGNWSLEPGLVEMMLHDVGFSENQRPEPGALPLLSHALLETWRLRRGRAMNLNGYVKTGGVKGTIARTAQTIYDDLKPEQQVVARDIFLRLTEFSESDTGAPLDTRRRVSLEELLPESDFRQPVEEVLKILTDARLVTTEKDTVEVAHEVLIREWPTLREWLEEDREGLRIHRHLTESALEWDRRGRDNGDLYRGVRLGQAEAWSNAATATELNALEWSFLNASLKNRVREERLRKFRRGLIIANAIGIIILFGVNAFIFRNQSVENQALASTNAAIADEAQLANTQAAQSLATAQVASTEVAVQMFEAEFQSHVARVGELAALSLNYLENQPELAMLLSISAYDLRDNVQTRASMLEILRRLNHVHHFLHGHSDAVDTVAFSPDGAILASGSGDDKIILWDVETNQPIGEPLSRHSGDVGALAFSPDGEILASGSFDSTIILWNVETQQPIGRSLQGHNDGVNALAFSPDGSTLASASTDGMIIFWNVETHQPIGEPLGEEGVAVFSLVFSPDGRRLASGSSDSLIIWDVANRIPIGSPLAGFNPSTNCLAFSPNGRILAYAGRESVLLYDVLSNQSAGDLQIGNVRIRSLAYSEDGRFLAVGGLDGTITLWNMNGNYRIGEPYDQHSGSVDSIAFSPEGGLMASGSSDNTILLWDYEAYQDIGLPLVQQSTGWTLCIAFSPDGKTLAVGNRNWSIDLWDTESMHLTGVRLSGHRGEPTTIAFSPDGLTLASGSYDQTIILWDLATGRSIGAPLRGHSDTVNTVVFSPDGAILVSSGADGKIILWDVETLKPIGDPITGHIGGVDGLAFTPDGKTIASGGTDGTIRFWSVETLKEVNEPLSGHTGPVRSLAFSPDGKILASGGDDKMIILWNMETMLAFGEPLIGHTGEVVSVVFSPDGLLLASAGYDSTVTLWDVAQRRPIGKPLTGHTNIVEDLAFSPDGALLASAGWDDPQVIIWNVDPDSWRDEMCEKVGRNFTRFEWSFYFPDKPYAKTCEQLPEGE